MHNKVNRLSLYSILIISLILQSTVLNSIKIFGARPDLVMLAVIFFGLFFGGSVGLEAGFIAGIFKDILSLDTFGINTLTLAITGFIVGTLSPKFFTSSRLSQAALVFLFSLFSMLMHYVINLFIFSSAYITFSEYLFSLIIPVALYTSLLSLVVFPLLINIYHLQNIEEYL